MRAVRSPTAGPNPAGHPLVIPARLVPACRVRRAFPSQSIAVRDHCNRLGANGGKTGVNYGLERDESFWLSALRPRHRVQISHFWECENCSRTGNQKS